MKLRSVVVPYVYAHGMSAQGCMPMPVRRMEGGPADRGRMESRFRLWMRFRTPGVLSKYCRGRELRQGYLPCLGRYAVQKIGPTTARKVAFDIRRSWTNAECADC